MEESDECLELPSDECYEPDGLLEEEEDREDEKWGLIFGPTTELLGADEERVFDPESDDFELDEDIRCASRAPPPPAEMVVPREGPDVEDDVDVPFENEDDEVIGPPLDEFESFCSKGVWKKIEWSTQIEEN